MRQTIFIPTDFSVASLQVVPQAVEMFERAELDIILFHLIYPAEDISGLLFDSRRKWLREKENPAFGEAISMIRNKYFSAIYTMEVEVFVGHTSRMLQNILDANKADCLVYNSQHPFQSTDKRSVKLYPLLGKCRIPVVDIATQEAPLAPQPEILRVLSRSVSQD